MGGRGFGRELAGAGVAPARSCEQCRLVGGDRFGQLLDERAEFAHLGRERVGQRTRAVEHVLRLLSTAAWRRPISATWRARSADARDRSASWLPTTAPHALSGRRNSVVHREPGQHRERETVIASTG